MRNEQSHTPWILHKNQDSGWAQEVEFREDTHNKAFRDRRRIEIKLLSNAEQVEQKCLIDSQGNKVEVNVLALHPLVARKLKVMWEPGKSIRPQDITELKRLTALERFNKEEALNILAGFYEEEDKLDLDTAKKRAAEEWNKSF